MLDDSLRRRLEALNRAPLPAQTEVGGNGGIKEWRNEGSRRSGDTRDRVPPFLDSSFTSSRHSAPAGPTEWLEIGEVVENSAGQHFRIVQAIDAIWNGGERLVTARHCILKQAPGNDTGKLQSPEHGVESLGHRSELRALIDSFPDRAMFLDLETCGLAGAALFLVGLLRRMEGRLAVELLLARNYAEEKAVLVSLWERAAAHDVLVTFNGKSFDWPMVVDRSTRYLLGGSRQSSVTTGCTSGRRHDAGSRATFATLACDNPRPTLAHVDILHHARRRWRGKLPDCKLQTLERYICGRRRQADIPGAEIPAAYQRFVEKGDPREMELILFHNALDLVTLLDLSMRLANPL